jgi:hypothetical protein
MHIDWPAVTLLVVAIPSVCALILRAMPNGGTKTDIAVLKSEHQGLRKSVDDLKTDMNKQFGELRKQIAGMGE